MKKLTIDIEALTPGVLDIIFSFPDIENCIKKCEKFIIQEHYLNAKTEVLAEYSTIDELKKLKDKFTN